MGKLYVSISKVNIYINLLLEYLERLNTTLNSELSVLQTELKKTTFNSELCAHYITEFTVKLRSKFINITGLYKSKREKRYIPITITYIDYYNTEINFKKTHLTRSNKQTSLYNLCIVSNPNFMKLNSESILFNIELDNNCEQKKKLEEEDTQINKLLSKSQPTESHRRINLLKKINAEIGAPLNKQ